MTETLTDFLRARIDEDAAVAEVAADELSTQWRYDGCYVVAVVEDDLIEDDLVAVGQEGHMPEERGAHIARHDPARVLRDVEAKRRIIDLHQPDPDRPDDCKSCRKEEPGWEYGVPAEWPCPTLRLMAAASSDRPDYDERWRP